MERLTKINGKYIEYSDENYNNSIDNRTMLEKCLRKLAEYEDLEEQGLLLRLPCKVGDTVYKIINQRDNYDDTVYQIVSSTIFELSMIDKIEKAVRSLLTSGISKEK